MDPSAPQASAWFALPRGGYYVRTFAGPIQIGIPPETIESIGAQVEGPLPPCAETQRFEGFEFNYEFFPAGATVCILPDAAIVLIAFVGGEFEGLDGYRASDAVTTIVLDRIARDWDLPGSLSTPPATPMATPVSTP